MNRRDFPAAVLGTYWKGMDAVSDDPAAWEASARQTSHWTTAEYASVRPFAQTLDRLVDAIERAGMRIFARIDHAAGARELGIAMPPTVLLIYGHARGGTPMMLAAPLAALELPLKVLVHEDTDGRTRIAFHPIEQTLREAGVPDALAARLTSAQDVLLKAVTP